MTDSPAALPAGSAEWLRKRARMLPGDVRQRTTTDGVKVLVTFPTATGHFVVNATADGLSGPLAELTREFLALTPYIEAAKVGTPHEGHDGWSTGGGADLPRCGCGELMEWLRRPT